MQLGARYKKYKFNDYFNTDLPSHWMEKRLGYLAKEDRAAFVDGPFGSDLKSSDYKDSGVPLIQLNNIRDSKHLMQNMKFVTEDKKQQLIRHLAIPGDIVIAKMADPVARAAVVVESYPEYVIVADCVKLTPNLDLVNRSFLVWAINCDYVRINAELVSTGTTRVRVNLGELKKLKIPYPPSEEQEKIANFLDHETAKIDTLIEKQQQLIALLKEKRQAVISHAVTKGLNANAPMRDSGVEWLGEVPEHWVVSRVKFEYENLDGRRIPLSTEERSYKQGEYPYYGATAVIDYVDDYIFDEDLVLVSEDGANLLMRSYPIAFPAYGKYWVNNHAHILKPRDNNTEFWAEVVEVRDLTPYISGSAQPKFTSEALKNLIIAVPLAKDEVNEIAFYIKEQKEKYSLLIGKAKDSITLMQERRTALISAAVTGKIDVRNWSTPEENKNKEVA